MISNIEYSISISPIGDLDAGLIKPIRKGITRIFDFKTSEIPLLQDIDFALDPARMQYHSTLILKKLEGLATPATIKLVAITAVDLFIPILTYVYGEAQLGGTSSIISTHRLTEGISQINDPETYINRATKEAIHELGHTFSLRHCPDITCIMHYSRTIAEVDQKSDRFCRYCTILLEDEKKKLMDL